MRWPNFSPTKIKLLSHATLKGWLSLAVLIIPFPDDRPTGGALRYLLVRNPQSSQRYNNSSTVNEATHCSLAGPATILLDAYYFTLNPIILGPPQQYVLV